ASLAPTEGPSWSSGPAGKRQRWAGQTRAARISRRPAVPRRSPVHTPAQPTLCAGTTRTGSFSAARPSLSPASPRDSPSPGRQRGLGGGLHGPGDGLSRGDDGDNDGGAADKDPVRVVPEQRYGWSG